MPRGGMRAWTLLAAALAASSALAGCADGGPSADASGTGDRPALASGQGAIAGLLVDDRYRPLHLTDEPRGEYAVPGFILVVETGQQVATDVDGVFTVPDLEPGSYTLRPSVERHEGSAQRVDVAAGQYAEVDLVVRRIVKPAADTVVVHDDTVLITCSVQTLDGHFTFGRSCHLDFSGDGGTNWIDYNYTEYGDMAAVVVEARLTRVRDFEVWLTKQTNLIGSEELYGKNYAYGSDYLRVAFLNGTEEAGRFGGVPLNLMDLRIWANVNGPGTREVDEATGFPLGADFTFVEEVRIVVSAFLEVPPDLETYALLA